jgi:hypothetical protein
MAGSSACSKGNGTLVDMDLCNGSMQALSPCIEHPGLEVPGGALQNCTSYVSQRDSDSKLGEKYHADFCTADRWHALSVMPKPSHATGAHNAFVL